MPLSSETGKLQARRQPRPRLQGSRAGARIRPCPPRRRAESPKHKTKLPESPITEEGAGTHSLEGIHQDTGAGIPNHSSPPAPGLRLTGITRDKVAGIPDPSIDHGYRAFPSRPNTHDQAIHLHQ